ncbi:MAG TPA: tetratricopeptide repeat protein [Treponemataceae bacterium]|jgi:tetratricopeptide (TPR) repeat protein|nr:MAG: tetratricopeptide repeat protein [Treponema sp.]HOC29209.1 tetratricopeptide repeat protein [Treponemataceae bacterium]HPX46988.1 tetratricopeptide repeat protein [Treponemataceae bacterium]HQL34123.1 tetratricopeptide repeat protein [Treponemataceae bacterium]
MSSPLDSLVFVSIPENSTFTAQFPGFDPSIPLPVQLSRPGEQFEASALSRESVLSGILAVLAWDRDNAQIEYYRGLLKAAHPRIREELTEAAILKSKNGDFELAEEIFLALHGLDPLDSQTILNLALLLDERAENMRKSGLDEDADALDESAFAWYRLALTAEPPLPDAFFNAGYFYTRQRNYRKAREAFETYLKLETSETAHAQAKKKHAREIAEGIAERDLDDELFKSAYDFIMMDQEDKALEQIRLFMESHPKVWNAWFLLGWALRKQGRWEDAKAAFIQALELGSSPDSDIATGYTDICNELAICSMELGDLHESRKWLEAGLTEEPENTKIIANLGVVSMKTGNIKEAEAFFRTALEIDPEDRMAAQLLANLEQHS